MFKVHIPWGTWSQHKDQVCHRANDGEIFGEIPSSIVFLPQSADIPLNPPNELVELPDPSHLSPQGDAAISSDLSEPVSNPPELSLQVDVPVANECQSPTSKNNLSLQRSTRTKHESKRLNL